jgi:hypothetical protein
MLHCWHFCWHLRLLFSIGICQFEEAQTPLVRCAWAKHIKALARMGRAQRSAKAVGNDAIPKKRSMSVTGRLGALGQILGGEKSPVTLERDNIRQ